MMEPPGAAGTRLSQVTTPWLVGNLPLILQWCWTQIASYIRDLQVTGFHCGSSGPFCSRAREHLIRPLFETPETYCVAWPSSDELAILHVPMSPFFWLTRRQRMRRKEKPLTLQMSSGALCYFGMAQVISP
jgi:hypothetical protein